MNKKLYPCVKCRKEVPIRSKNMCPYCRSLDKESTVKRYILKQSSKNRTKKQDKSELMRPFWEYHLENMQRIGATCENCGCRIQGNICNIAHILPKRNFGGNPEVAHELNNCLYLCTSINAGNEIGCHDRYDRIQATSKVYLMNSWVKCIEKYLTFRDKVVKYNKYVEVFETWMRENGL